MIAEIQWPAAVRALPTISARAAEGVLELVDPADHEERGL